MAGSAIEALGLVRNALDPDRHGRCRGIRETEFSGSAVFVLVAKSHDPLRGAILRRLARDAPRRGVAARNTEIGRTATRRSTAHFSDHFAAPIQSEGVGFAAILDGDGIRGSGIRAGGVEAPGVQLGRGRRARFLGGTPHVEHREDGAENEGQPPECPAEMHRRNQEKHLPVQIGPLTATRSSAPGNRISDALTSA